MAYKIFTDSGANLSKEQADKYGVTIMNMGYIVNGEEFVGKEETEEFIKDTYNKMKNKGTVSTNAVNKAYLAEVFEKTIKEGFDILYVSFVASLSSSCDNAKITAQEVVKEKGGKIVVIDSCCASMGQGMLVMEAAKLQMAGKSMEEVAEWIDATKLNVIHLFTVDNLAHLYRGGRLKKSTAIIGSLLKIKPIMEFTPECVIVPCGKALGRNLAIKSLANLVHKKIVNAKEQTIYIAHAESLDDAIVLQKAIAERVEDANFEMGNLGLILGAHAGPGTLAVFFLGNR